MNPIDSHPRKRGRVLRSAAPAAGALIGAVVATLAAAGSAPPPVAAIPTMPASLAALYPPATKEPVHLLAMLAMQDALAGIVADQLEGDTDGARAAFSEFADRYRRAALLVPEWRAAYPEAPLQELAAALAGSDPERVMRATDAVGSVCHSCHMVAMGPVQLRFRWGNFTALTIKDPVTGDTGSYADFKRRLAVALTGVTRNVGQGQVDGARRQFDAFSARFAAMRQACIACHATPRRAFVDREVQGWVEELGRLLESPAPDPPAVTALTARIGQASCSPCHLVHVPAALAQAHGQPVGREAR